MIDKDDVVSQEMIEALKPVITKHLPDHPEFKDPGYFMTFFACMSVEAGMSDGFQDTAIQDVVRKTVLAVLAERR